MNRSEVSHPLCLLDQECLHQSVWISFSCFSSCLLVSSWKTRVLPMELKNQKHKLSGDIVSLL